MSNENDPEQEILGVHIRALEIYLDHRRHNPGFTFDLKQRGSRKRPLKDGWVFRQRKTSEDGRNSSVYTSPYRVTDKQVNTPFVGFVVWIGKDGNYRSQIEFLEPTTDYAHEIMDVLYEGRRIKPLPEPWEKSLVDFLKKDVPKINEIAEKHGVLDRLLYREEEFEELRSRI